MSCNGIIKTFAAPLVMVYMLAVVGFDVHLCGDNGKVYVESLLCDVSCQALHPETVCHCHDCHDCGRCCHQGDEAGICAEDCCMDLVGVLTVCSDDHEIPALPQCVVIPLPFIADVTLEECASGSPKDIVACRSAGISDTFFDSLCTLRV